MMHDRLQALRDDVLLRTRGLKGATVVVFSASTPSGRINLPLLHDKYTIYVDDKGTISVYAPGRDVLDTPDLTMRPRDYHSVTVRLDGDRDVGIGRATHLAIPGEAE